MKNVTKILIFIFAILLFSQIVMADDCTTLGGVVNGTDCELSTHVIKNGTFNIAENLHLFSNGSVDATGFGINLIINGSLTMDSGSVIEANDDSPPLVPNGNAMPITIDASGNIELKSGSSISAEDRISGGSGADIKVNGKSLTLHNNATISSSRTTTGGAGNGGKITINADSGGISLEPGSIVASNSVGGGKAGLITIASDGPLELDGLIASASTTHILSTRNDAGSFVVTGGDTMQEGGPINITCKATAVPGVIVSTDGIIVSQGEDKGADSITISGCRIEINGLVASVSKKTGKTHVTLESGNGITVNGQDLNGSGPNKGRVRADAVVDGPKNYQVNMYAKNDININGPLTGRTFAVSSRAGSANTRPAGGTITLISLDGAVNAVGKAFQAGRLNAGNDGGAVNIFSKNSINLNTVEIEAVGDYAPTGGLGIGGNITVRSYSGNIDWQNGIGDVRPTGNSTPNADRGNITLISCTGTDTTGTVFNSTGAFGPTLKTLCSPAGPSLPEGTVLPVCVVPICGDGIVNQPSELCDDGVNNIDSCTPDYGNSCHVCTTSCQPLNFTGPYCGDDILNGDEQCDGQAGLGEHQTCSETCTIIDLPFCGDGQLNQGEQCDDGNLIDGDGCNQFCEVESQVPEFSGIASGLAVAGAGIGYIFLRRKK